MLFSPKYGHNHYDPLHLSLFAQGQELLPDLGYSSSKYRRYSISTMGHNTVLVDSSDMKTDDISVHGGQVERFVPVDELLQWMRVRQHDAYPQTEEYSRELWWIPFPGEAAAEGYAVDLFRVVGGTRHEYLLQGDANRDAFFSLVGSMDYYGATLLPKGVRARGPINQHDFGDAGGHYPGYMYVRDVSQTLLPEEGSFRAELVTCGATSGSPGAGMRIIGLLEKGENTLYLGRAPSLRSTRLFGKAQDSNAEGDRYDLPKLLLRREGKALSSTFATLFEPYGAERQGSLASAERLHLQQGVPGATAIRISYGDVTDLVLSNPGYRASGHPGQPLVAGDVSLHGEMGFVRWRGGELCEMVLVCGDCLQVEKQQLLGDGPLTGAVTGVRRIEAGDEMNALSVDAAVPSSAKDRYVIVKHPDGRSAGYSIRGIRREGRKTWLLLGEQDPGFVLEPKGSSREVFHPQTRWNGTHCFSISNVQRLSFPMGSVSAGQ